MLRFFLIAFYNFHSSIPARCSGRAKNDTFPNESVMSSDWLFEFGTMQPEVWISSETEDRYVHDAARGCPSNLSRPSTTEKPGSPKQMYRRPCRLPGTTRMSPNVSGGDRQFEISAQSPSDPSSVSSSSASAFSASFCLAYAHRQIRGEDHSTTVLQSP